MSSCLMTTPDGKSVKGRELIPSFFRVIFMSYIENRMGWIMVISGLVILMAFCIVPTSASPQLPCEFYGSATNGGTPVAVGTEITAYVNGVKQGSIKVKEAGKYGGTGTFDERLIVLSGENDFSGGAPMITFKIGDTVADQSVQYTPGTSSEMALTSGGTPVVIKTPGGSPSQGSSPVTPMQAQSTVPSTTTAPAGTTAPVSMMQAGSTGTPASVQTVAPVITAAPTSSVPASSGSPTIMSIPTTGNSSSPVVLPVATSAPTNKTTILTAPVLTTIPTVSVPVSSSPSILSVSAPVNNTSATSIQKTGNQTVSPVTSTAPVVPVKTAAPVVTTVGNLTNVTKNATVPSNLTSTVSFPSGQTITK
ncbi:hypothetical protein DK846_05735 [Methanospirillum lacunae]|uniref:Uncharacterized protein n=3 Tax=Methanospirillum lacunae TaxID=668570 RepID=A0A2V2MZS2_9EURY|nr:hypothetical protein DK846_05735 [Methanospirillum lacunae]